MKGNENGGTAHNARVEDGAKMSDERECPSCEGKGWRRQMWDGTKLECRECLGSGCVRVRRLEPKPDAEAKGEDRPTFRAVYDAQRCVSCGEDIDDHEFDGTRRYCPAQPKPDAAGEAKRMYPFDFSNEQVLAEVQDTEYAKGHIAHHLQLMTGNERMALYRAIAKLSAPHSRDQSDLREAGR